MLYWLIIGCTSGIHAQYRARADAVLAPASPASRDWEPDIRLRINNPTLHRLSKKSIAAGLLERKGKPYTLKPPIGPTVQLKPQLTISGLEIRPSASDCTNCLDLAIAMDGKTRWSVGQRSGKLEISADAEARVFLEVEQEEDGQWSLALGSVELQKLKLDSDLIQGLDISKLMQSWVEKAVEAAPEIPLGSLGGEDMPLRAVRVRPGKDMLQIEALSDINGAGELPENSSTLDSDWDLQLSQETLTALLRREAFEHGAMTLDLALDPQSLVLEEGNFSLGLRLWRLRWLGWWRDYRVDGTLKLTDQKLKLDATEVLSLDQSRCAGLVDPLALIAERKILSSLENGIHQTIPLSKATQIKGMKLSARADKVYAGDGILSVEGDLKIRSKED
jgi:hypothetical protein